ncbi:hypothetical protein SUGI_0985600 [Cryptomeria japonica]|uniref:F-box protein At1g10780 n=1 Tax=Cryptomeria japonica TaxID=3369 RepID=UPI002414A5C4|nr:F-box protein At1g10780 [Cryptomeria japonica]XP_057833568.2 F-box protein At1g10780 [Cryptomeria japonica]XP_057833569.2 F-box protein At1g10780 [Cryptomeria japonica]XP_057833571.2 F-box protein At1g10780 [Cryptomeria japonica]GLJ46741.1 hypothetical protein SUGI_0985600 [Cryptomeria japonica]
MAQAMDIDDVYLAGIMEVLPDAVVQYMLSSIRNARDVAICACVCQRWREAMVHVRSLYFPRTVCDEKINQSDAVVNRMVLSTSSLEELIVYCPFSGKSLLAWLSHTSKTLKHLELRMDNLGEKNPGPNCPSTLDYIASSPHLESLKLWGVSLKQLPAWNPFIKLHTLEVVGVRAQDTALYNMLLACPMLKNLALLGCDGAKVVDIELKHLEQCRLDFYGIGDCFLNITAPKLQVFEIQGAAWIRLRGDHSLRQLSIANNAGKVSKVECGRLSDLESLSMRGVQWSWDAIDTVLQSATEVKNLVMKIEFSGDTDRLLPFPEINLVDFFTSHPRLTNFEVHGAMFAALSQKNSLLRLDDSFSMPCLEEISITVRSPLNADQKMTTLESLVKHGRQLRRLTVRVSQMKNCQETADKFFEKVLRFKQRSHIVIIE